MYARLINRSIRKWFILWNSPPFHLLRPLLIPSSVLFSVAWEPLIYAAIRNVRVFFSSFFFLACETTYDECTKNLWFSQQINKKQKKTEIRAPALLRLQQFLHRKRFQKMRLRRLYRRQRSPEPQHCCRTCQCGNDTVCHWEDRVAATAAVSNKKYLNICKTWRMRLRERSTNQIYPSYITFNMAKMCVPKMMNIQLRRSRGTRK